MIYLIGMPGVGKSYWANQLGAALHLPVVDLDAYIVQYTGKEITALFAISEAHFRAEETAALQNLAIPPQIIACGGGTPCFNNNIDWMLAHGLVIWLDDHINHIAERILQDTHVRPLLKTGNLLEKLTALYEARLPYYQRAAYRIDVNQPNSIKFVTEIIKNYYESYRNK